MAKFTKLSLCKKTHFFFAWNFLMQIFNVSLLGMQMIKWASSRENVFSEIFDQVWLKPVCSATATS